MTTNNNQLRNIRLIKQLLINRVSSVLISFAAMSLFSLSYAHSGGSNTAAWDACDNKKKSEMCAYSGHHKEKYLGTCQSISKSMMCVRNQAIKFPEKLKDKEHDTKLSTSSPDSKLTSSTVSNEILEIVTLEQKEDNGVKRRGRNKALAI